MRTRRIRSQIGACCAVQLRSVAYSEGEAMSSNPSASGKNFFAIEPRRSALIVIDMQNAFVAEGAVFETPGARVMIPRLERLIKFARTYGIPIVWTQSDHRPPYGGQILRKFPAIAQGHILWQGYKIVKHKFDAFFETDLEAVLRYHQVDTVIITGTASNACCESTARSAFMRDYKVVFPSDLNATFDEAMHQATLRNIDLFFGRVVSSDELVAEMEAALEASSRS